MSSILQATINALALSSLYMLIAIGFTLIFGVGGILNLSHAGLITTGAFVTYIIVQQLGAPLVVGIASTLVVTAALGALIYKGLVRYVESTVLIMVVTLLVTFVLQHLFRIFTTRAEITVPFLVRGEQNVLDIPVLNNTIAIFVISWLAVLALFYLINNTEKGNAIIAVSMSTKGANLVGINIDTINLYTWTIGSMMAGFAGVLLASLQTGQWNMGIEPMILAFSIVILGGLGSVKGSVIGAHIIGFAETFTTSFISSTLTGVVPLLILVGVLLVKPEGLFGREVSG